MYKKLLSSNGADEITFDNAWLPFLHWNIQAVISNIIANLPTTDYDVKVNLDRIVSNRRAENISKKFTR